jgi:Tfp pilus assembly protein PilN
MDDINLLPSDFIERQQRHRQLRIWLVVLAFILVALPGGWLPLRWQLMATERHVAALRQQHSLLAQDIDKLKVLRQQQQKLHTREEIITTLFYRAPLQQLFFDIAALTDEELWLTRFQLHKTPVASGIRASQPLPKPPKSFFTSGRAATSTTEQFGHGQGQPPLLLLHGYTTSNQRLADFMSGLAAVQYLSQVSLQVAQWGKFLTYEAIEFVIEIHP